jgi:ribosomal protein S18 acetylase RimI-like enzyme
VSSLLAVVMAKLKSAWRMLVREPRRLPNLIRFDTYAVFSARVDDVVARPAPAGVTLRQLTSAEVSALTPVDEDISDAMERCGYLADRAAFGGFYNGAFAHISWMIAGGPDGDNIKPPRLVGLRPGEAEITYCVTLPEYRGRQIYPFVISRLFQEARTRGIREIFMVTRSGNVASQHGILKAGLNRLRGRIFYLHVYRASLVFRTFRMWRRGGSIPSPQWSERRSPG